MTIEELFAQLIALAAAVGLAVGTSSGPEETVRPAVVG